MKLNEFLHLSTEQTKNKKMHCAIGPKGREREIPLIA